ncbi:MAG: hypothetical protein GF421_03215 [Candidatus Aminicenantes bacterium]|nr:hypothetical protein [Candidatus Aminicenantes bacterium]
MTKNLCFLLILILTASAPLLCAKEEALSIKGQEGELFFNSNSDLNILYATSHGEIRLHSQNQSFDILLRTSRDPNSSIYSITTTKDRFGDRWVLWEERGMERSDIYLARFKNKSLREPTCLTEESEGFHYSPTMTFDAANELFTAWVHYDQGDSEITVKNTSIGQSWQINSYAVLDPQLLSDEAGRIWLFWVGQYRNCDEILYSFYEGGIWQEPVTLNRSPDVPHIMPSAILDDFGFLHVVWSAYDGQDYELYTSFWDGNRFSEEEKITDNHNISDASPFLNLFDGKIPAVTWVQNRAGNLEVRMACKRGDSWSQSIQIPGFQHMTTQPKTASSQDKTWVLWQGPGQIQAVSFHHYQMLQQFQSRKPGGEPEYETLALDQNKFIGFGDSITYGFLNNEPAPDKGYVPRLEDLIQSNLNPNATVLNRGKGGEKTSGGLSRITSVINSDQAKTIFLMEGTNDVKDTSISISTAAYNLEQMANKCVNFNMKTFLSTIIPRKNWDGVIKDRILTLNAKINNIASSPSIHFVDNFSAFYNHPAGWTNLLGGPTHPTEAGYQLMAQTWYNAYVKTLPPTIDTNKDSLYFEAEITDTEVAPKEFKVKNAGGGTLSYDISTNKDWITVSPSSGKSSGEWDVIEVSVDLSDLSYGLNEGEVTISSDNATNSPQTLDIDFFIKLPPLYPPANFQGEKKEDRSLSLVEYINVLSWDANDQNEVEIDQYKIYLIEDGEKSLVAELSADTFEYQIRDVEKDKVYKYGIASLDVHGRESGLVYTEFQ